MAHSKTLNNYNCNCFYCG